MHGATSRATRDRLAGLHAVIRAVAYERSIPVIETADVRTVRRHFIGQDPKRAEAKRTVMQQCRRLGWAPANDNEGDALALFHYRCSIEEPRLALQTSPLFRQGVSIA